MICWLARDKKYNGSGYEMFTLALHVHVCAVRIIRRDDGINDVTFVSHWDQLLKSADQPRSVSAHRRPKVIATKRGVGERAVKSRRGTGAAENGNKSAKQSLTKLRCR